MLTLLMHCLRSRSISSAASAAVSFCWSVGRAVHSCVSRSTMLLMSRPHFLDRHGVARLGIVPGRVEPHVAVEPAAKDHGFKQHRRALAVVTMIDAEEHRADVNAADIVLGDDVVAVLTPTAPGDHIGLDHAVIVADADVELRELHAARLTRSVTSV